MVSLVSLEVVGVQDITAMWDGLYQCWRGSDWGETALSLARLEFWLSLLKQVLSICVAINIFLLFNKQQHLLCESHVSFTRWNMKHCHAEIINSSRLCLGWPTLPQSVGERPVFYRPLIILEGRKRKRGIIDITFSVPTYRPEMWKSGSKFYVPSTSGDVLHHAHCNRWRGSKSSSSSYMINVFCW